ncbi:MAG TPA: hypothetical protein VGD83_16875 [Streptosporangiaceae bacterium]
MSEDSGAHPGAVPRGLRHHDQPLYVIEIADPDEAPGGPGQGR